MNFAFIVRFLAGSLAPFMLSACTFTHEYTYHKVDTFGSLERIPGRVTLLLTNEFADFTFQRYQGDKHVYPMKDVLADNAVRLVQALYADSEVVHAPNESYEAASRVILVPRVVGISMSQEMWAWEQRTTTFSLEWTLRNGVGEVVWVATANGETRGTVGNAFSTHTNVARDLDAAMQEAFRKSYELIGGSDEVRSAFLAAQ